MKGAASLTFGPSVTCNELSVVLNVLCYAFAVCSVEFPVILRDSLEVLYLNDNQLEFVPQSVCGLHSLTELYLAKLVSPTFCNTHFTPASVHKSTLHM